MKALDPSMEAAVDFFIERADIPNFGGCWLWRGPRFNSGYGRVSRSRLGQHVAHRLAFLLAFGSLPPEPLELDHRCQNRACVNPAHLQPVTGLVNVRRARGSSNENPATCMHDHVLAEVGVYRYPSGGTVCRECRREHRRQFTRRHALKAA